jgi:hypothetical protein
MASITAQILIGVPDQYHDGINPTHYLFLSENDRPAWLLREENIFSLEKKIDRKTIVWIPTLENMLEDALLMISIYILKDETILKKVRTIFNNKIPYRVEAYADFKKGELAKLYDKNKNILEKYGNVKIVITILKGSHIYNRLKALENYKLMVEICKSQS